MKLLVISQHLFPMQTPRAHRTTELVKELGRQGHAVTLYAVLGKYDYAAFEKSYNVTVKNIPIKWMAHPYSSDNDKKRTLIDKILGRLLRKFEFPNIEFKYRIPKLLKNEEQYDALISIADPHQIHWGVAKYKKQNPSNFPKVWIADCGDPFMFNGAVSPLNLFEKDERNFCELCDNITVPIEEGKQGYYAEYRKKIEVIPQGFDFDLSTKATSPKNEVLSFAFAGNFYKDIRNPASFLKYISKLTRDFRMIVFTPHPELISQYQALLGERLVIKDALPRTEMIEELAKMDFLLNIENVHSPAQVPSKLIDYAITRRPILSINPIDLNTKVVDEFFNENYEQQFVVKNIEQYQIKNVAAKFLKLIEGN